MVTNGAASAAPRSADDSASCSLSGEVKFSPPLTASGGGINASHISAKLSGCTTNADNVSTLTSARLTGMLASSPFACSQSEPTNPEFSGVIGWHGKSGRLGGLMATTVRSSSATGSFAGSAAVSLQMPPTLSTQCAKGTIRAIGVSGTVEVGLACGQTGSPISIFPVVPPICGGQDLGLQSITAGPDGALWFTTARGNVIGRTTTAGHTTFYSAPGTKGGPLGNGGITAGSDGALWFIADDGAAIGRITTSGSISTFPVPSGALAAAVTSGPDGALWFTVNGANGTANWIGQLTTTGQLTTFTDPSLGVSDWNANNHRILSDITTGPDGALWFSMLSAPSSTEWIGRITTAGAVTEDTLPFQCSPGPLTTGPDGNIWFGCTDRYAVGQLTMSSQFSYWEPNQFGVGVFGITSGPDGALWYTIAGPNPQIGRITTGGTITTYAEYPKIWWAMGITTGSDGALWFVDTINDAVGRISVP